jgi:hypothetical protein
MENTATSVASTELTEQVLSVQERATHPLTFFQIQRRLPRPFQDRTEELRQVLQELTSQGRLHEFAPYRSKAPRYWTREPQQFARVVIEEILTEQARTQRELLLKIRNRLHGVPEDQLRQLLAQMLLEGRVRKLPPRLGGRSNLLSARESQPRDYLASVFDTLFDTLGEVAKRLESEGIRRETFRQEAEAMWRALPWDRLGEPRAPRRRAAAPAATDGTTPFEPAAAATEVTPGAQESGPEEYNYPPQEAEPGP